MWQRLKLDKQHRAAVGFTQKAMPNLSDCFLRIQCTQAAETAEPAEEPQSAEQAEPAAEETKPAEEPQKAENSEPEAQKEPVKAVTEPEAQPEKEQKPAEQKSAEVKNECPVCPEAEKNDPKKEKPAPVFYSPSVGLGIGASIFSMRINNDIDFLLKHTADGTNVYMGLEIDFRYSPYMDDHSVYEIPLQVNMAVDFPIVHHNINRVALWFSAGIDLAFGYVWYYDYDDEDWESDKDRDTHFKALFAWGFGVNLLFKNNVTLKLGFDSFYGKYPDIICAAGYRF